MLGMKLQNGRRESYQTAEPKLPKSKTHDLGQPTHKHSAERIENATACSTITPTAQQSYTH